MKNKINDENYEEVMFGLLEHQYSEEEKEEILFDIERDPLLNFEWKQFQKCQFIEDIKPYEIEEVDFWKSLLKKEEKIIPIRNYFFNNYIFGIAAAILLLIVFTYLFTLPTNTEIKRVPNIVQVAPKTNTMENERPAENPVKTHVAPNRNTDKKTIQNAPVTRTIIADAERTVNPPEELKENNLPNPESNTPTIPIAKREKYVVKITSENISASDFAMMEDYDISNSSRDDQTRINEFLKTKQTNLAQLLKNTSIQFKQKDNKIYLMAYGDNQSQFVWEIANQ